MPIRKMNYDLIKYVIPSCKLSHDVRVVLISDLHDYTKNRKKALMLSRAIKEQNPHHIIIAGDILQGKQWLQNRPVNDLRYFLEDLSEEKPVFIRLGNHDFVGQYDIIANFMKLNDIHNGNVYPIYNEKRYLDNFVIFSYTPRFALIHDNTLQQHGYAHDNFIRDYEKYGVKIDESEQYVVEFVGHNPHLFAQSVSNIGLSSLSIVDTIYAGHLHNGYMKSSYTKKRVEHFLDMGYTELPINKDNDGKLILNSINPLLLGKIDLCRGVIYIDSDCHKKLLELRNGKFYFNDNGEWVEIGDRQAYNYILSEKLKALVVSGGVKKFSSFSSLIGDTPEIDVVDYQSSKSKVLKLV